MLDVAITVGLVLMSATFSGLTLGLIRLGPHELKRKIALGNKNAKKIYPIRKKGNLLLVTLCLSNVAINAALSIFLGSIANGLLAGLLATALITVFGEIVPQALFSRFAMELGARSAWLVRIFIFVLYPVCAPLAWALNKTLGEELPTIYSKRELVQILEEHGSNHASDIQAHEEKIARGALTYGQKKISEIMTPRAMIASVMIDDILTKSYVDKLVKRGYSRYPVFDRSKERLIGILYMYRLINKDYIGQSVSEVYDHTVNFLNSDDNLDQALGAFIKTKQHLYGVVNQFGEIVGVVGIEDVLEEIIGEEIVDEFDEYDNVRAVAEKLTQLPPHNTLATTAPPPSGTAPSEL